MVAPANDLVSETWKGVHSGRASPPLLGASQRCLVVPVCRCLRSPLGTGMSPTERKQSVIPRYYGGP